MVIQIIRDGRRLPFWIMELSVFGPLSMARDPIIYVPIKFGEDILIGSGDMLPKVSSKKHLLVMEFYFWFQL